MHIDTKSRTLKGIIEEEEDWEVGDITKVIISTGRGVLSVIEEMGISIVNYQNKPIYW